METGKASTEANFDKKIKGILSGPLEKVCLAWRRHLAQIVKKNQQAGMSLE